jgi:hypothetical protein
MRSKLFTRLSVCLLALCLLVSVYLCGCGGTQKSHTVTYRVTGTAPTATIIYSDDSGPHDIKNAPLPWSMTLQVLKASYLTAGAVRVDHQLQATIELDGKVVCDKTAPTDVTCEYHIRPQ